MTIVYVETHLTQDPVYDYQDNSATFIVALSELSVTCHIHRQENLSYIHQNELRSGDIVKIQGVFVTTKTVNTIHTFIKVHTIRIVSNEIQGGGSSKKRKLDEICCKSPNSLQQYKEVVLNFSEYYFLLSGQAYSILDNYNSRQLLNPKSIQAKADLLSDMLKQLYEIYKNFSGDGINQLHVVNFVNTATSFIKTLKQINNSYDGLLPENIRLSPKIPLPSFIYHAFINE
ncbi:hypothetical protein HPULCUR_002174 [Helicostylum pulchrum]|uniref:Uncharacterized protein n=1 Tax=Helicostylum pulchrum TaxID=562976 RepID=A0ABP9XPT7_9FUNG